MSSMKHVPNTLTLLRIASTPAISYWICTEQYKLALAAFTIAGISDGVDGYIARRYGATSPLGSMLDPLADKVLMTSVTVSCAYAGILPQSLAALIIGRDIMLAGGASYYRYASLSNKSKFFDPRVKSVEFKPTSISKFNTMLQLVLIGGTLINTQADVPYMKELQMVVAASTLLSGASYFNSSKSVKFLSNK